MGALRLESIVDGFEFDGLMIGRLILEIIKLLVWFKIKKWEKTSLRHLTKPPISTSTSGRKTPNSRRRWDLISGTSKRTATKEHNNSSTHMKFSSPPKRTTKSTSTASSGASTSRTSSTPNTSNPTSNRSFAPPPT